MIFTAPKFIAIDDKSEHLESIIKSFQQLGSPCIGIQYNPAEELNKEHFRGVRCLLLDLHLVDGQATTDNKRHYALIASILEDNISPYGGPFIIVIWSEHSHLSNELKEYLDKNLDTNKPYTRPLAVLSLAKDKFIANDGVVKVPEELKNAIREAILESPQLAALLSWEAEVLIAAGNTLASLINLVPLEQRTSTTFSGALDVILSRLAKETVGEPHVASNQRSAITHALAPILADKIINQDVSAETTALWEKAVTKHADNELPDTTREEAGQLNRILHLAIPSTETIKPTDWGAVVNWPYQWNDAALMDIFGHTINQLLGGEFLIEKADRNRCTPVLVRIGASCDYAQNKLGPITYLLGVKIPEDAERKKNNKDEPIKLSDAIWKSPIFITSIDKAPMKLHVHIRFPITILPNQAKEWEVHYRIREQLLMNLITSVSNYVSRPGIVSLPAK